MQLHAYGHSKIKRIKKKQLLLLVFCNVDFNSMYYISPLLTSKIFQLT